jgi:VIT1/CCC1 family predicted Fe2+/Mn2+ transporter
MEREVHSILGPLGVKETLSRLVAEDLREVEDSMYVSGDSTATSYGTSTEGVVRIRSREDSGSGGKKERSRTWWRRITRGQQGADEREALLEQGGDAEKHDEDMGLTAFLLKFGEGMEEVPPSRLYISALTIGISYFLGGLIPLIPYMIPGITAQTGLIISSSVTAVILFIFGAFKTYFTYVPFPCDLNFDDGLRCSAQLME